MAALCNRAGHYTFALWFLSSSFFLFFLAWSQRSEIGCLPSYFHTRCGLSVNLECRSEIAACGSLKNTGRKNYAKNRHLGTIAQVCQAISSQLRHASTIGKSVKHQFLIYMSLQYGELRPTRGWDRFVSLGHPNKFQRVSRLGFVTAATSLNGGQPNFARCVAVSWAGTLQRPPPIFGRVAVTLGIDPHSSFVCNFVK